MATLPYIYHNITKNQNDCNKNNNSRDCAHSASHFKSLLSLLIAPDRFYQLLCSLDHTSMAKGLTIRIHSHFIFMKGINKFHQYCQYFFMGFFTDRGIMLFQPFCVYSNVAQGLSPRRDLIILLGSQLRRVR